MILPYALMPAESKKDKLLQTINFFSQIHLAYNPSNNSPVGVLSADTTLASKTYRLR